MRREKTDTKTITFRIPVWMYEAMEEAATDRATTITGVLKEAITLYLHPPDPTEGSKTHTLAHELNENLKAVLAWVKR